MMKDLPMNTIEMLDALAEIGCPRLSKMGDGTWCASIELPAPKGVTSTVRSDFDHPTHESALTQLMARLGAVEAVGERAGTLIDAK